MLKTYELSPSGDDVLKRGVLDVMTKKRSMRGMLTVLALIAVTLVTADAALGVVTPDQAVESQVDIHWAVKIPLRDGVQLNATSYLPHALGNPAPCVVTMTPYVSQTYHARGIYFASQGLPFVIVDVRGRGNSEGVFAPNLQERTDGYDVVEWLAKQPFCNGRVGMWGGSYAGYAQWVTAASRPPHLSTIVPAAAPYIGADFPFRNNIASPYLLQWLFYTAGRTGQDTIFNDDRYWASVWLRRFEAGESYASLGQAIKGFDPPALREWIAHPEMDEYWDRYNPTEAEYRSLSIPILTITGSYDGDQLGAIAHYRAHLHAASTDQQNQHFLIIGPWDHAATRTPRTNIGGLTFGPASLVDLPKLHTEWYNWTMGDGPRPAFLHKRVVYYVMGAEKWRYADTLEAVTASERSYGLDSSPTEASFRRGILRDGKTGKAAPDTYLFDPHAISGGAKEAANGTMSQGDLAAFTGQSAEASQDSGQLVYLSEPFENEFEVSGFPRLTLWLSIDQPDTDFTATLYEVDKNGGTILLSQDLLRARYRESLRKAVLVTTKETLRYDFAHFTFSSRRMRIGSRLKLVVGPLNSIYWQKNFNSGQPVSTETMADARTVRVRLVHDHRHPSALSIPLGQPE